MDNLRLGKADTGALRLEEAQTGVMNFSHQMVESPEHMTFLQRLRYTVVVHYLHRLNLTSYRRLRRAYAVIDEAEAQVARLAHAQDETAQLLRTVAADRDRLGQEVQTLTAERQQLALERERFAMQTALHQHTAEQLKTELEALRAQHARLQQDYETLRASYDQAAHKNTALETALTVMKSVRSPEPEELVILPLTVKVETSVARETDVDAYMVARGNLAEATENDTLYYTLETSLRGSEEEIKHRQAEYLPYITIVNPALPVVDLGCGRGEFLELMREQGIRALGVDTNSVNVEELKRKGLEVYQQDALAYLRDAARESLAAITAFQVIEHVPNDYLRELIKLAYEKLASGGFLLLETVNPYCLEIYRTYYLDPTHRNPIPVDLLSLLYHYYGFTQKQTFYQSPIKPTVPVSQSRQVSFVYQSYAIMGTKPRPTQEQLG